MWNFPHMVWSKKGKLSLQIYTFQTIWKIKNKTKKCENMTSFDSTPVSVENSTLFCFFLTLP